MWSVSLLRLIRAALRLMGKRFPLDPEQIGAVADAAVGKYVTPRLPKSAPAVLVVLADALDGIADVVKPRLVAASGAQPFAAPLSPVTVPVTAADTGATL